MEPELHGQDEARDRTEILLEAIGDIEIESDFIREPETDRKDRAVNGNQSEQANPLPVENRDDDRGGGNADHGRGG